MHNLKNGADVLREAARLAWSVQDGLGTVGALHRALTEHTRRQLLERSIADPEVRFAISDLDSLLEVSGAYLHSVTRNQERLAELLDGTDGTA